MPVKKKRKIDKRKQIALSQGESSEKRPRNRGRITHQQACEIGQWDQAQYHLTVMAQAGLLKHDKYNTWVPASRRAFSLKPRRVFSHDEVCAIGQRVAGGDRLDSCQS